jgi:hypothetical protein
MQNDPFSLDAQMRQIKEQAERDGVEIVKVFADPVQSACRKKYRPGVNALRKVTRHGGSFYDSEMFDELRQLPIRHPIAQSLPW